MSHHLRSCVKCARHIRITESTCPFCKSAVASDRMTPPPRGTPAKRLGRAFAVSTLAAASLGASATACGSVANEPGMMSAADAYGGSPPDDGGNPDVLTAADAYGLAPADVNQPDILTGADAYGVAFPEGGFDVMNVEAAYGVAEPPETGVPDVLTAADAYGRAPDDAGADVITGGQAYGVAEPQDGGPPGHP